MTYMLVWVFTLYLGPVEGNRYIGPFETWVECEYVLRTIDPDGEYTTGCRLRWMEVPKKEE